MPKKIGILGGLSPESTVEYYLYLTHTYTERYGNYAYPEIIIYSVSFQDYVDWPASGRWDLIAQGLSQAAQKLEAAGADFIIISISFWYSMPYILASIGRSEWIGFKPARGLALQKITKETKEAEARSLFLAVKDGLLFH